MVLGVCAAVSVASLALAASDAADGPFAGVPGHRLLFGSMGPGKPGETYDGSTPMLRHCRENYPEWYCPTNFPIFPTSSEKAPDCKLAIVGAGTGGLYTAMRLIDTDTMAPSDICIFEMTERVAGRIYSLRGLGPNKDLTVDAGGYRTWPRFTPVLHELITEYLGIPMDCYAPPVNESDTCQVFNIIDEDGKKAGFATTTETMMTKVTGAGARFFPMKELMYFKQETADGPKALTLSGGMKATADTLLLNVPQRPLFNILRDSTMPDGALDSEMWTSLHTVQTLIATKVYLYYENAWWIDLGFEVGDFFLEGDATKMPLAGRYHDGQVECDNDGKCHGFLLAAYVNDFTGENSMYFRRYQEERPEPVTIISDTETEHKLFLEHAHARLVEYHTYHQDQIPAFEAQKIAAESPPKFAVMSTWNIAVKGAGAGWHGWTDLGYVDKAMDPLGEYGVHTVNEAYSLLQGWAEGTLMAADDVLLNYFGVEDPWPFEVSPIVQVVRQTNPPPTDCVEEEEGGGPVAGGGDDADILCFVGSARLLMANGTHIPLAEARVGEYVSTGKGKGKITEVLVHKVEREMVVAVVPTEMGELVGTRSHPVLVSGEWIEIEAAHHKGYLQGVKLVNRHVDAFYNLEIDGHLPGESEHAYVVNGVVASGLGDNEVLNTLLPRQNSWIAKAGASA